MPIYDAECPKHGMQVNVWGKVDETLFCHCGAAMRRLISPTRINPDIKPYMDTDMSWEPTHIKSRRHRDEVLKEKNLYAKTNNRWV